MSEEFHVVETFIDGVKVDQHITDNSSNERQNDYEWINRPVLSTPLLFEHNILDE